MIFFGSGIVLPLQRVELLSALLQPMFELPYFA
jgi:hypothetical protein